MSETVFPSIITNLPEADIPVAGIRGWLLQDPQRQAVFLEIQPTAEVPPHSHGEQWGTVIDGEMDLTIAGTTHRFKTGDSYHIPAGAEHSARFLRRTYVLDLFADADRYRTK